MRRLTGNPSIWIRSVKENPGRISQDLDRNLEFPVGSLRNLQHSPSRINNSSPTPVKSGHPNETSFPDRVWFNRRPVGDDGPESWIHRANPGATSSS